MCYIFLQNKLFTEFPLMKWDCTLWKSSLLFLYWLHIHPILITPFRVALLCEKRWFGGEKAPEMNWQTKSDMMFSFTSFSFHCSLEKSSLSHSRFIDATVCMFFTITHTYWWVCYTVENKIRLQLLRMHHQVFMNPTAKPSQRKGISVSIVITADSNGGCMLVHRASWLNPNCTVVSGCAGM